MRPLRERTFVGIGFSEAKREENLLNRIQFQIPQRLIPSTSLRSHCHLCTLAAIEGVATSHRGRSHNLRRNQLPWFTFLTGKWNTNGATRSVKNTRVLLHIGS